MLIIIGLITIICALAVAYIRNVYSYWERRGVPYEKPIFPFGNIKSIGITVHFRDVNERIYKRFKGTAPFAGVFLRMKKLALILDPELIKSILFKDFSNFRDYGIYSNPKNKPLDNQEWHSLRIKLSPGLTSEKMQSMFPTIVGVSDHLIGACDKLVAADKDGAFDVKELCARYTTDVIGICAFDLECNTLKDPNAEFGLKGRSIFEKPRQSSIVESFIFTNRNVNELFMNAVRNTVEDRIKYNVKCNDFMDRLIKMKVKDEEAAHQGKDTFFSRDSTLELLAAQSFAFFVAGFDTSFTTMAFCLYELALNQDIQNRLRAEIENVLKHHYGQITYRAMNKMTFLEQVWAETLRKYSVLPHLLRQAKNDYKVPNSNLIIEAGTKILIPIAALQSDPEYFPEPQKFDPSRFEPEEIAKRQKVFYLPFGDGPDNCIGLRFGKMQAKVGLINLLKHYRFMKSPRTEDPIELDKRNIIIAAKNGIYLHAEKL